MQVNIHVHEEGGDVVGPTVVQNTREICPLLPFSYGYALDESSAYFIEIDWSSVQPSPTGEKSVGLLMEWTGSDGGFVPCASEDSCQDSAIELEMTGATTSGLLEAFASLDAPQELAIPEEIDAEGLVDAFDSPTL